MPSTLGACPGPAIRPIRRQINPESVQSQYSFDQKRVFLSLIPHIGVRADATFGAEPRRMLCKAYAKASSADAAVFACKYGTSLLPYAFAMRSTFVAARRCPVLT